MPRHPKIRYGVAMSLDGFIAGPNGEYDWIPEETGIDFGPIWAQFDTFLMGRRTWKIARLGPDTFQGKQVFVASRTLHPGDNPGVTVLREITRETLRSLRRKSTKDIWLFGGRELAGAVYELGELDGIDLSLIPVLLTGGIPLLPPLQRRSSWQLRKHQTYASGVIQLEYTLVRDDAPDLPATADGSATR